MTQAEIKQCWHRRLDERRQKGEWFVLTLQAVNAFEKRRVRCENGTTAKPGPFELVSLRTPLSIAIQENDGFLGSRLSLLVRKNREIAY